MPEDARWDRLAIRFLVGLTFVRLVWHLFQPVGILGDETYYWEWGRHFAWGYFSKPPLIGWLYGVIGPITGHSIFAFKAVATLLTSGGLWLLYRATCLAFDQRVAFWALLASALGIGNTLLASILTIDTPLLFAWSWAMYLYFRLLFEDDPPWWRVTLWLALALALGHLSKQMMLAFPPLMLIGAWFVRRDLLKKPYLYAASLLSLFALFPTLVWNDQNNWITFRHTAHHFEAASLHPLKILWRYVEFIGVTALIITPVLFWLMTKSIWSGRNWKTQAGTSKLLLAFGGIPLAALLVLMIRQDLNPNWPAVFYPAALIFTTWWCLQPLEHTRMRWFRNGVAVAGALSIVSMIVLPFTPAQQRGWHGYETLALRTQAEIQRNPLAEGQLPIVIRGHRFTASQLAFHLRKEKDLPVHFWPGGETISSQYDFWPGPPLGGNVYLIVERANAGQDGDPGEVITRRFEEIVDLDSEFPLHPSRAFPTFKIYLAKGLRDWPALPLQTASR